MSIIKGNKSTSKYKENKQVGIKESNTLDNKHRIMVKQFSIQKNKKDDILNEIKSIQLEIEILDERRDNFTLLDLKHRATLLDKKDILEQNYKRLLQNYDEMDYYDNAGDLIKDYYNLIDLILIMSVNPGFGGQKFLEDSCNKIIATRKLIDNLNSQILLAVDGGINQENIGIISKAGANVFVAGSSVFKNNNFKLNLNELIIQLKYS